MTSRRYRTTADVLNALFALPSDSESDDDFERSSFDSETQQASEAVADEEDHYKDDDDSDDDVLYCLADETATSPQSSADDGSDTGEYDYELSDDDETDWKKQCPNLPSLNFDSVGVMPSESFLPSDGSVEYFSLFFDDEVYDMLIYQTNLYAAQQNIRNWHDVSKAEMKAFFGVLIAMGLHTLPDIELYWSSDPLFNVPVVSNAMTVKRFKKILQALHINDNKKSTTTGRD